MSYRKYTTESYQDGKKIDKSGYIGCFWGILLGAVGWGLWGCVLGAVIGFISGAIIGHILVVFDI